MSHDEQTTQSGEVTDIFAHRFVIKTPTGKILADLGPKGAERVALKEGDHVEVSGERRPSELKVSRITKQGGEPIDIEPKKKPLDGKHGPDADPKIAVRAARDADYEVIGEPKRRSKHFELQGRKADGGFAELHIELDGKLRRAKPVALGDDKWASEMSAFH
jgi:hypothetical protein